MTVVCVKKTLVDVDADVPVKLKASVAGALERPDRVSASGGVVLLHTTGSGFRFRIEGVGKTRHRSSTVILNVG